MPDITPPDRRRLALFPLPVVLLPDTPMPLHIFEQPYRDMVRDTLAGDGRFGMVYHDWDRQGPFLSEEGRVGCIAEIKEHQELEDGRSLMVVEGQERFRIEDGIESESLYFEALVEEYGDEDRITGRASLDFHRAQARNLFVSVVETLPSPPDEVPRLPDDRDVSFLLAHTIQGSPEWHQQIIESRDESERLAMISDVFRSALDPSG